MDEIAKLRQQLKEVQRLREEEQRLYEEEQRRREKAEDLFEASQPQLLVQYLEACHSLNCITTNPAGRICPRRIIPWEDFPTKQEEIWNQLSTGDLFSSQPSSPSQQQLEYVRSLLRPISSEDGVRNFERDVVENAVQILVDAAYNDSALRTSLDLQGSITFQYHTNLGESNVTVSEAIYKTSDGRNIPALAIEYNAPHKLSWDEVVTGLTSEIRPDRDVINKEGEGFAFASRSLAAAVVTQLFSSMIGKGIQYGYVCTGETFVFLRISDDPGNVYYAVCVPNLDVQDGDETRLHRTAVAQVFAFLLQAIRSPPPSQAWQRAAQDLDTWAVEYEDVLRNIPETVRKEPRTTPYIARRWKGFTRSPIRTRSRCLPLDHGSQQQRDDENSSSDDHSPSPTSERVSRPTGKGHQSSMNTDSTRKQDQRDTEVPPRQSIQDRPYCTHQCLRGLALGGPLDEMCPNIRDHRTAHVESQELRRLIREQLAVDLGHDADCAPLYISGSRGSLFKVCLSSHGYTLVAKGVEQMDAALLQHEDGIYSHLRDLQGVHIPVCLGTIDLIQPYFYNCGVFTRFLFLSYGGRPLPQCQVTIGIAKATVTAFAELHKLRVLHGEAEPRNALYDPDTGKVMVVDFERSGVHTSPPLGSVEANQKRKHSGQKPEKDIFVRECQSLEASVARLEYTARQTGAS